MAKDYYGILGVERSATVTQIKKAYREKARLYHPDVNDSPDAVAVFQDISISYEVLIDPEKRRIVDQGGDPMDRSARGGYGTADFGGFGGGLGDIFDAFFGGASQGGPTRTRVRRGNDALVRVGITFAESNTGVTKSISVDTAVQCEHCDGTGSASKSAPTRCATCDGHGQVIQNQQSFLGQIQVQIACPTCGGTGEIVEDPCEYCNGDGRVKQRETLEVAIPAGIDTGMQIKKPGAGEIGPGGGPSGDLYVEVTVQEHEYFTRVDDDLTMSVYVPIADAVLGTQLKCKDAVGEDMTIKIPAGTAPGQHIVMDGAGMPKLHSTRHGNLIVEVLVDVPQEISGEEKSLWKNLKKHQKNQAHILSNDRDQDQGFFSRMKSYFK